MSKRETLAVADLIPGDVVLPEGYPVYGYAYGQGAYTVVPMGRVSTRTGFLVLDWAYADSEIQVDVIRD
jgi:hypothetical protein